MPNRKHSETSTAAKDSLKAEDIRAIYQRIIRALQLLGCAHTERIAECMTVEHCRVHKRISEMEKLGIVFKPGGKMPMKSGRNGYLWQLTATASPKTDAEVRYHKEQPTAAEIAIKLIKSTLNPTVTQPNLF